MINCTSIPVALPRNGPPPKTAIKIIIGTFMNDQWRSVAPERLVVKKNAGANENYTIERPQAEDTEITEPRKVFLKLHGERDIIVEVFKQVVPNKQEEAQLCHKYGQSGLGAKVYGFFKTIDGTLGRVDEFLNARSLEPEDVEDASIRGAMARGYAAFHAMKTQLGENPVQVYYDVITRQLEKFHKADKLKRLAHEAGVCMDSLIDYDFAPKIRCITDRLESIGGKKGWCIHDVAFMNAMVRVNPRQGESKIVLIDFEFVFRNYRAFDIGGHFMQKVFKWVDEDSKLANCRSYMEEEKMHFCDEYAQQWNRETGDSDTGEQILRESELGYLLAITFEMHNMLCYVEQGAHVELLKQLDICAFKNLLEEFDKRYKGLGLDIHSTN